MTAVRIRTCVERGKVTDLSHVRPPTDVMAITSLSMAPSQSSGFRSPLIVCELIRYPPTAKTYLGTATTCPWALSISASWPRLMRWTGVLLSTARQAAVAQDWPAVMKVNSIR